MKLIETTKELEEFCDRLEKQKFITVDLEFLREKTYYAQLCLIQVGSIDDAAIIDPLAKGIKLDSFFKILKNKKITKVFHSCRQDIEILFNLTGLIPEPLFDTQIAAMVCGLGENISYENLVIKICGIGLDKTSRLSDWSKRPLTENQLQYALSDVTHLVKIYEYLNKEITEKKREHWLDEEYEILKNPETYDINPKNVWQKIRHRSHNPKFLTVLRELAAWREKRSKQKDTTRQSAIKDDMLLNIAAANPSTIEELMEVRGMRKDIAAGKLGAEMIEVLNKTRQLSASEYVKVEREKSISCGSQSLLELLRLLLKITSQKEGVVARLIADDEHLRAFGCFMDKGNPILKGWRFEVFGKNAVELREGNLSIRYNKENNQIDIY